MIALKDKIRRGEFFLAPGISDMISAIIAKKVGFDAVYASGYWMGATAYGVPHAGITTLTQMVDRVATLATTLGDIPVIADSDTGFGGLLNVRETVRLYEKAGAQIIQFEDQEFPKKCGHTKNKRLEDADIMSKKVRVAKDAITQPETMIIARTDGYQSEGLDGALRRLEAYVEAGADILFPEGLATEEEMHSVCKTFDLPVLINMVDGGDTPILDAKTLEDIGFAFAIFPATVALSAAAAVEHALTQLKTHGTSVHDDVPLFNFAEMCKLVGFEDVWAFEDKWYNEN